MAEEKVKEQANQVQTTGGQQPQMPELDYSALNKYLSGLQAGAPSNPQQVQGQPQGQPPTQWQQPAQMNNNQANVAQPPQESAANANPSPTLAGEQDNKPNPDVVSAQEEFKDIKDGDTYVDDKGQKWEWVAVDFNVVPEEEKDDAVDTLSEEDVEIEEGSKSEGDEGEEDAESEENLERGLDIALSVLREEDNDHEGEESAGEENSEPSEVAEDAAYDIVMSAIQDVLRPQAIAQDDFHDPVPLTQKRQGYPVDKKEEIPPYLLKRKRYEEMPGGGFWVKGYQTPADKHAMENARLSHRRTVAATWENCRAKDKARCPYHGAAYMTDMLANIIQAQGLPLGKFGVIQHDPEATFTNKKEAIQYRLLFSVPEGTAPEVRSKIAKLFFGKNPNILVSADALLSGYGNNMIFRTSAPDEDIDDMPVGAPTKQDYLERHDTSKESEYAERAKARGAVSWTTVDTLPLQAFFNMLSERPTNMVECCEDMLRYAEQFPEFINDVTTLEDIRETYKRFMKANKDRNGFEDYILNGEITDGADALAKAAQAGMEQAGLNKGARYYDVAQETYSMAQAVFNRVQDGLSRQFFDLRKDSFTMPSGKMVAGVSSKGKSTVYFGEKFKSRKGDFPMFIGGKYEKELRNAAQLYQQKWNAATRNFDFIREGCEQREPLLVSYGLGLMQESIRAMKEAAKVLGEIQDKYIESRDEKWMKKNGISLKKADKQEKSSPIDEKPVTRPVGKPEPKAQEPEPPASEKPVKDAPTAEKTAPVKKEKPIKTAKEDKGEKAPKKEKPSSEPEGRTSPNVVADLTQEQVSEIIAAAKKDKGLNALNKARTEAFQNFGEDSEQYKSLDKRARDAYRAFIERYKAEKFGIGSSDAPTSAETKQETVQSTTAQPSNSGTPESTEKKKSQTKKPEPSKPTKVENTTSVKSEGKGQQILKGIEIEDKPTLEGAKKINGKLAELEKRIRGLVKVYTSKTSDSPDWEAAESEMKSINLEIKSLIQKAKGKGYQWTKDSPRYGEEGSSDKRPLDMPTNFHISGITDETGNTVDVPYTPPKQGTMNMPVSSSKESPKKTESSASKAKPKTSTFQKKSDYSADFDAIEEKIGDIGSGPYKGKTIQDLFIEGYEVKPVKVNGKTEWVVGKPSQTSSSGIEISPEHPPITARQLFEKRMGGDVNDENALRHFVEALRWKVNEYNRDNFDD